MKRCRECNQNKSTRDFGKNRYRKDGLQWKCKKCDRVKKNANYASNPQLHIQLAAASRRRKIEWFQNYKKTLLCKKCGDDRHYVLDFHHIDDKVESIAVAMARNWSKSRIMAEVEKCIVLCSCCHRELHYFENRQ